MASSDYLIVRPEKAGWLDLLHLLIFRPRLSECDFIDMSVSDDAKLYDQPPFLMVISLVLQKFLLLIEKPLRIFGHVVEFPFNLFFVNGGLFGLLLKIITFSVVIPKEGTETWWSFLGLMDPRLDLTKSSSLITYLPQFGAIKTVFGVDLLELMLMASKVAYENAAVVEYAVTKRWKMNFVGFYDCWNKFTKTYGTQAYIFTDTAKDASMIVVSFRGTAFWAAKDYVTDVDFSFLSMGKMGKVHIGLLKALGLQDEKDYVKGWPKDYTGDADKIPVYYVVREQLRTLIQKHPNAKIIFTGHSMGAALSSIFPALLSLHEETDILDKTAGILNNGRLRPGDKTFGNYMVDLLKGKYCLRVTYRYDIIVRVPFDNPFFQFKHFGKCIYYKSWYHGEVVMQEPNRNYFNLRYFPNMYYTQFKDFFTSLLILPIKEGKEYRETVPSLIYRAIGFAIPGVPCHSPRDYLNAIKLGKVTISDEEIV